MPHLVVLSGAGISAESGIETFRAADGLWANHPVEAVATPEGWRRDPERVLEFYAERRRQIRSARPNAAHRALAELEGDGFRVTILTQNIDDLHERAGSKDVMHLHGNVMNARSSVDPRLIYPLAEGEEISLGDLCDKGSQLRPHVVWFGEPVLLLDAARELTADADLLLVVGTSLNVMPVAGLIDEVAFHVPRLLVDPRAHEFAPQGVKALSRRAAEGVPLLVDHWRRTRRFTLPDTFAG